MRGSGLGFCAGSVSVKAPRMNHLRTHHTDSRVRGQQSGNDRRAIMAAATATYEIRPVAGGMPANPALDPRAECRGLDPEMWFTVDPDLREFARMICADCPIRVTCEQYGIATRQTGIWGGSNLERGRPDGVDRKWRNPYPILPRRPRSARRAAQST
jgi:hypothetical protein